MQAGRRRQRRGASARGRDLSHDALAPCGAVTLGDINVTPLVDVVLVLLLVFMVTAPMMSRGHRRLAAGGRSAEDRRRRIAPSP